ncbi:MAG TPA: hypothetical protein VN328_07010 [Thermodesulfovibrionales bacterium]|nr:hypothetical protein [Thermodesulfovibrionales bacterium]
MTTVSVIPACRESFLRKTPDLPTACLLVGRDRQASLSDNMKKSYFYFALTFSGFTVS